MPRKIVLISAKRAYAKVGVVLKRNADQFRHRILRSFLQVSGLGGLLLRLTGEWCKRQGGNGGQKGSSHRRTPNLEAVKSQHLPHQLPTLQQMNSAIAKSRFLPTCEMATLWRALPVGASQPASWILSMSGSFQVLSNRGFSGPYRRNRTSNLPSALLGTQFDSLAAGAFGPK